ncbi:MAG: elongation factor G [Oscillospiraceae bacterium]|jgi:elongation factor G|nr:elongation factor G [Oscillospiraceae bacterium]
MRLYKAENIKNVALAGHGGSGKTSLAEALLYLTKATDRLGKALDGNTVMDFDPEEVKRKVSVSTAVAALEYQNTKINLIDTPGLFDFEYGLYEGVRPAESVLMSVSGKDGVTVGLEKAYKLADAAGKSKMIFIGTLDNENADFFKAYNELKERFGSGICPVVIPHVENHKVTCYIDIATRKAFKFDAQGNSSQVDVPDDPAIEELYGALCEAVAETGDELMEKFFEGEEFTLDEILGGLNKGAAEGKITPVYCGSATTLEGVSMLLHGMAKLLPSAAEKGGETSAKGDKIICDENKALAAYVFKTVADPFVGKLSYVKVISGRLSSDQNPLNSRTGEQERLGKVIFVQGKKQEETQYIPAGDIGAVTKLSETITGDTLCDPKKPLEFARTEFPKPTMSMSLTIKNKGDEAKISSAIQRLMEEDPTIAYIQDAETLQQIISGMGDQHLDVIVSKLKSKFGIDVSLEQPKIAFRETIRKKVSVRGRHKKQSGGHGQFGDVVIEFEPHDGEDLIFEERVVGGAVPKNFFPAVEKGLRESIKKGVLAGYPVVGLRAVLVDGSYHPVDSSEMAFKTAASIAYKEGVKQASPVILEPIYNYTISIPDDNTGDIIGEVNKRRGRVLGMNPDKDGLQTVEAQVPMAEMFDFTTVLRSITQGRGRFSAAFSSYELVPPQFESKIIEESKKED